jgi:hypothetical protein
MAIIYNGIKCETVEHLEELIVDLSEEQKLFSDNLIHFRDNIYLKLKQIPFINKLNYDIFTNQHLIMKYAIVSIIEGDEEYDFNSFPEEEKISSPSKISFVQI